MRKYIAMKQLISAFIIFQFVWVNALSAQESDNQELSFHPFVQYGAYSIIKLENPELYESITSSGDIIAGINLSPNKKCIVGLFAGFENVSAQLINMSLSNSERITNKYLGASLKYIYSEYRNFNFYAGISTLLIKVDKDLTLEKCKTFENGFDYTIIGIQYSIQKHLGSYMEIGAGETGFIRFGLVF